MAVMSFSTRQRIFIDEYLTTFNATEAARRAGYSERTASEIGYENLRKPHIAAEVRRRLDERLMSADEVLARTADIARGDLTAYITPGQEIDIERLRSEGKGHLLKKFRRTRRTTTTRAGDVLETDTVEIELYPADAAHDRLMRYHGLYNDRVRVTTWQDEIVDLLRRGEIAPADVTAAYPDLAIEFFTRAGIAQEADVRAGDD